MSKKSHNKPVFVSKCGLDFNSFKKTITTIAKSQLWLLVAMLLAFLVLIQYVHTDAHLKMEQDVHGYCKKNIEHQENLQFEEDDW